MSRLITNLALTVTLALAISAFAQPHAAFVIDAFEATDGNAVDCRELWIVDEIDINSERTSCGLTLNADTADNRAAIERTSREHNLNLQDDWTTFTLFDHIGWNTAAIAYNDAHRAYATVLVVMPELPATAVIILSSPTQ